jgi:hypothetical protein
VPSVSTLPKAPIPVKAPSVPSPAPQLPSVKTVTRTTSGRAARSSTQGSATSRSASNALAVATAAALFSTSGYGSAPGAPGKPAGPGGAASQPTSGRDLAALTGLSLRDKVRLLAGCLSNLPERLRLVLEMRAGILTGRPLTLVAVSHRLHVSVRQARRMQRRALKTLLRTARSQGCGTATGTATRFIAGLGTAALTAAAQPFGAAGGVLAARYSKPASQGAPEARQGGVGGQNALGLSHPGGPGDALTAIGLVLAGTLLIAILFAEELGLEPHFRRLRARWLRRPPR